MLTQSLGDLLGLPSYHHFFNFPVYFTNQSLLNNPDKRFIILYLKQQELQLVTTKIPSGASPYLNDAQRFSLDKLPNGLVALPFHLVATAKIIALPKGIRLTPTGLRSLYPKLDVLTKLTDDYNPYREATDHHLGQATSSSDSFKTDLERDYDEELQSFSLNRQKEPLPIPMEFWDDKTGQSSKIYVRGWYLFDNQPPLQLSWKPGHSRRAYWRTSNIFADRETGKTFFRGETIKNRQSSVFLDSLSFSNQKVSQKTKAKWQDFLGRAEALKLREN